MKDTRYKIVAASIYMILPLTSRPMPSRYLSVPSEAIPSQRITPRPQSSTNLSKKLPPHSNHCTHSTESHSLRADPHFSFDLRSTHSKRANLSRTTRATQHNACAKKRPGYLNISSLVHEITIKRENLQVSPRYCYHCRRV